MDLIIVGGFSEIFDLCESCGHMIVGYIDKCCLDKEYPYEYLGSDSTALRIIATYPHAKFVISPDSPSIRENLVALYLKSGASFCNLVSQRASVARSAVLGMGLVIQWGAFVSSNVQLGSFVKLNVMCNIMHDVVIGDYTTIAPNAALMGRVKVGSNCYIGANSTIKQEVHICDNCTIGAGAVVVKDIVEPGVYAGVPATKIREK